MTANDDICLELLIKNFSLAEVAAFVIARDEVRAMRADMAINAVGPITVRSGGVKQTLRCAELNTVCVEVGANSERQAA